MPGVSLIELLIVVTLVGTMVGGAAIYYDSIIEERRIGKAKTELIQLSKALKTYETRNGKPITPMIDVGGQSREFDLQELVWSRVMNEIPDDPWSYEYTLDTTRGVVICGGPDGRLGTPDDIEHQYKPPFRAERAIYRRATNSVLVQFSREVDSNSINGGSVTLEGAGDTEVTSQVVDIRNLYEIRVKLGDNPVLADAKLTLDAGIKGRDGAPIDGPRDLSIEIRP